MTHRLLAFLGSIAYGIRQFLGALLSFVGLRNLARFGVPLLIALLGVAAVISARDTATILASRPEVQETTLAEVAGRDPDAEGSIWFEFTGLMDETSHAVPAEGGTFFYLARDPSDPATGLLVRSPLNDAFFRQRVVTAAITEDPAVVSRAVDVLGALPSGFRLDDARFLDELEAEADPTAAAIPSELSDQPSGAEVAVTGRVVSPATYAACAESDGCEGDDAAWFYYLADPEGGAAFVLRSPHPPQAIPVRLQGLFQRDTFDLEPALASDWYAAIDASVPTDRAFAAGRRPPITVPASWVPTIIFGTLGLILLASQLVGYPVFGKGRSAVVPGRRLAAGDGIDFEITGRLAREQGALTLDRSPGAVERLAISELALRMWRYGLLPRDLSRREAEERFVAEAAGDGDRLVIHERDQSALVPVERDPAAISVDVGRLHRVAGSRPAVHVRQGATDAYLTTSSAEDRDRAASEILGESIRPEA